MTGQTRGVKMEWTVIARRLAFVVSAVVTIVSIAYSIDSHVDLFAVHAVNMTSTAFRPSSTFDVRYVPFVITFLSSLCLIPQMVFELDEAVWWRWADWTITVPIMMALISALAGVRDVWLVAAQAFLAIPTILSGVLMDASEPPAAWIAFAMGGVTMLFSWITIFWHLSQTEAPPFVYGIVGSQFGMFLAYPAVAAGARVRGWTLEFTELVYTWLGTVTKAILAFILVFGVRAQGREN
jgi:hypothetical protein